MNRDQVEGGWNVVSQEGIFESTSGTHPAGNVLRDLYVRSVLEALGRCRDGP